MIYDTTFIIIGVQAGKLSTTTAPLQTLCRALPESHVSNQWPCCSPQSIPCPPCSHPHNSPSTQSASLHAALLLADIDTLSVSCVFHVPQVPYTQHTADHMSALQAMQTLQPSELLEVMHQMQPYSCNTALQRGGRCDTPLDRHVNCCNCAVPLAQGLPLNACRIILPPFYNSPGTRCYGM